MDLTVDDVLPALERGLCAVTGIPFVFDAYGKQSPLAPSLDRPDSSKPYTKDNFRLVLWCINAALGAWGLPLTMAIWQRAIGTPNAPTNENITQLLTHQEPTKREHIGPRQAPEEVRRGAARDRAV